MAYVANIVTVAEMNFYAGAGIDTTAGSIDANHTILQDHAEAHLSTLLKFNLTAANWALLTTGTKELITEWAARYCAIELIRYNMLGEAGALTRIESENRINLNVFNMKRIEKLLESKGVQDFLGVNS